MSPLSNHLFHQKKCLLTPIFLPGNGTGPLTNRGWVHNNSRQFLPNIETTNYEQSITGYVYYYNSNFYDLADDKYVSSWPLLMNLPEYKLNLAPKDFTLAGIKVLAELF